MQIEYGVLWSACDVIPSPESIPESKFSKSRSASFVNCHILTVTCDCHPSAPAISTSKSDREEGHVAGQYPHSHQIDTSAIESHSNMAQCSQARTVVLIIAWMAYSGGKSSISKNSGQNASSLFNLLGMVSCSRRRKVYNTDRIPLQGDKSFNAKPFGIRVWARHTV